MRESYKLEMGIKTVLVEEQLCLSLGLEERVRVAKTIVERRRWRS